MFRCCSLETSHPRLLPQSPKVCSKNMERFTNLHVILAQGWHANLLCIVPILVYVLPKRAPYFSFIKWLFSTSLLSAIRVVSSAYLRLLIFLPAILIPAYASSSLAFCLMYSAYMLNKQVTMYSLDVLLSQFWIIPLFHGQFYLLLLDLHIGFSGNR